MEIVDQLSRKLFIPSKPQRIISLVPSFTEMLHYFGMEEEVVGITKFCVHPKEWHENKSKVGGTKQFHIDKVKALQPNFVIANKEENNKTFIDEIASFCPVYVSDIPTMETAFHAIRDFGKILERTKQAETIISTTKKQLTAFQQTEDFRFLQGKTFLYFVWHKKPDMVVGQGTYINNLFEHLGMINLCKETRYPVCQHDQSPEYVFLSSEPFPFAEKHVPYFQERYPHSKIVLVDGEIFAWYGSWMMKFIPYMEELRKRL